ncbi:MAG TPA: zinc-ribbon domain-containing protein, partial [Labilithrix sp.]|nr:zinc-ribbon domain-containing protein [Labilithrix sp.]
MDVRCERCSTEYEFDDALVSGRGTTVKCTNCGHKFKIRRSDGDFSEDFWNVQTGDGRTLVFTSLRELQRAIQTNLVDRNDLLSRGGLKQKAIGQIPELAPFFDARDPRKSLPAPAGDPTASASEKRSSRPPPPPGAAAPSLAPPMRQRMSTRPDYPPPPPDRLDRAPARAGATTLIGTGMDESESRIAAAAVAAFGSPLATTTASAPPADGPAPAASAPPAPPEPVEARRPSESPPATEREPEPDTERFAREAAREARQELTRTQPLGPPAPRAVEIPRHTPPPRFEPSSPLPPPVKLLPTLVRDDEYDAALRRASLSDNPPSTGRRRSVGGFLVAVVVLAGVALLGLVWAKDHLRGFLGKPPAPVV